MDHLTRDATIEDNRHRRSTQVLLSAAATLVSLTGTLVLNNQYIHHVLHNP